MKAYLTASVALCAALCLAGAAKAQPPERARQCFFITQMQGWHAPDDRTIYIRVNMHDYYRLDLVAGCPQLTAPDVHLITKSHGSSTICSAIDWDLSVAQSGPAGFATPCIVSSMSKLTPAEVAAIPPRYRP